MKTFSLELIEKSHNDTDFIQLIMQAAETMFEAVWELSDRDYHGGYFVIAHRQHGFAYAVRHFGISPFNKAPYFMRYALEKAWRLSEHPEHECSAQSRKDEFKKYPGSIAAGDLIFSFSGLDWQLDECICLCTAILVGKLTMEQAREIAKLSGNDRLEEVLTMGIL